MDTRQLRWNDSGYLAEDIDTYCPLCNGAYDDHDFILERVKELVDGGMDTRFLHNLDWGTAREYDTCPLCGGEDFELMWNTLYEFDHTLNCAWDEARVIAWDAGFLLFEGEDGATWLASGSCGYDFSWRLIWTIYLLSKYGLSADEVRFLSNGGHVFVKDDQAVVLAKIAAERCRSESDWLVHRAERWDQFVEEREGVHNES